MLLISKYLLNLFKLPCKKASSKDWVAGLELLSKNWPASLLPILSLLMFSRTDSPNSFCFNEKRIFWSLTIACACTTLGNTSESLSFCQLLTTCEVSTSELYTFLNAVYPASFLL